MSVGFQKEPLLRYRNGSTGTAVPCGQFRTGARNGQRLGSKTKAIHHLAVQERPRDFTDAKQWGEYPEHCSSGSWIRAGWLTQTLGLRGTGLRACTSASPLFLVSSAFESQDTLLQADRDFLPGHAGKGVGKAGCNSWADYVILLRGKPFFRYGRRSLYRHLRDRRESP